MTRAEELIHDFALAELHRQIARAAMLRRTGDHLAEVAMAMDGSPIRDIALQAAVEGWLLVAVGLAPER